MADTEQASIEQAVIEVVLSREGKRRYSNGDPLTLDPSDLRDIVRLTMAKCASLASRPAEVDEPQQILSSMTHTARRDHLCAFCGMTVQKNERYVRAQSPGGAQAKKAFHSKCYAGLVASAGRK